MKDQKVVDILNDDKTLYVGQTGVAAFVADYKNLVIEIHVPSSASHAFGIQGSVSEDVPDFASAQSKSNRWDYLYLTDLSANSDVGAITISGAFNNLYKIDAEGLRWVNIRLTDYTSGSPYIRIYASNNS